MDETVNKKSAYEGQEKEIVFSQSVKAGKRVYYLDVKRDRRDDLYLSVTESKKIVNGMGFDAQVTFEKHKIFLYKEDIENFAAALTQAVEFIKDAYPGEVLTRPEYVPAQTEKPSESAPESDKKADFEVNF